MELSGVAATEETMCQEPTAATSGSNDGLGGKLPACDFRSIAFSACAKNCAAVDYLGVGECESCCPHKFDANGKPVPVA